jgi:internalin A
METLKRRPWWSYLRLSMRSLLFLVLVLGAGLGWMVHLARVQRDAVEAIVKAGGSVYYDWELSSNGVPNPNGKLWWPGWLVDRVGVDYFSTVRQAFLIERDLDGVAVHVGRLGQLERLYLTGPSMTDARLVHIEGLTKLRGLDLEHSKVTDAGLVHLKGLRRLEGLSLKGTKVTDAGARELSKYFPMLFLSR